ncbi:MAG: M23 family metallopeptidase [Candidatus Microthrix sp.]|nr:M23 family metallopeptidase [Candidatus Microthrix sp.]
MRPRQSRVLGHSRRGGSALAVWAISLSAVGLLAGGCATTPPRAFAFPVKSSATRYARTHHHYPAADMFAPCGTAVVAPTDAVVEEVETRDRWRRATRPPRGAPGLLVSRPAAPARFRSRAKVQVSVGQRVSRGQRVGSVGDTGNAKGTGCHLHFGLSPACLTGWQNRRGKLAPQPYLDSWRKGARNDPAPAIARMACR